jgi:hypothetical protein
MIKEIAEIIKSQSLPTGQAGKEQRTSRMALQRDRQNKDNRLERIRTTLVPFVEKAKRLLILERHALQKGHITYEKCDDPEIKEIRSELFSDSKSHGGMFKDLIDEIDNLLFMLIKNRD